MDNTRIDPKDWTIPELIKHTYREVENAKAMLHDTLTKLDTYASTFDGKIEANRVNSEIVFQELRDKINDQRSQIEKLITQREEQEKAMTKLSGNVKLWIAIASFVMALASTIIQIFL